jgi:hypothetical protein
MNERLTKEEVSRILEEFYSAQLVWKLRLLTSFKNRVISSGVSNIAGEVDGAGLGDCIIMTPLTPEIKISEFHRKLYPGYLPPILLEMQQHSRIPDDIFSEEEPLKISEIAQYDWGGGHCIQRLQKGLGVEVSSKPRGKINYSENRKIRNKVFVHIENGTDFKRTVPNSLDSNAKKIVFKFFEEFSTISINRPDWKTNYSFFYYNNNFSLEELISEMETCEFFLGIDSGPMHLAAAMNLKSVIIINDPTSGVYLPRIKECDIPNSEWLYPQNVHLNRAGKNSLVPEFSLENLRRAFDGTIYPYWSDEFLELFTK